MGRFTLSGKRALVTGGTRGLGLEIARELVRRGTSCAVVARDEAEVDRARAELYRLRSGADVQVLGLACDLTDAENLVAMLAEVDERLGPVDILVNNAGIIQVGPLDAMTPEDFASAMQLHCDAPLRLALALRPSMRARGGGRIANIASIGGVLSVPHLLPYSISKFALVGLSLGLQAELAAEGIRVSTIIPGLMRTGSAHNALFKGDGPKEYAWFALLDGIPGLSMDSTRAARRIVRAIARGEPHVVLGLPAKLAMIAPGLLARVLSLVSRLLPRNVFRRARPGVRIEPGRVARLATALNRGAALRNNELRPGQGP
jgi:NAD(P)-dependent dehydrogenase (short-subunit alcohol dehydrogenase family)